MAVDLCREDREDAVCEWRERLDRFSWGPLLPLAVALLSFGTGTVRAESVDHPLAAWQRDGQGVLEKHCTRCHGGVRRQANLDLRSLTRVLVGGDQKPALVPGSPDDSLVYLYALPEAEPHMPPEPGKPLSPEELQSLRAAIAALPSAVSLTPDLSSDDPAWPRAYVAALDRLRPRSWTPPAGIAVSQVIDGFVEAALSRDGVRPAPRCDDRSFVRRLFLDVAGRIPTVAEAEEFLADSAEDKRERLTDRLLGSPEHARRMSLVLDAWLLERKSQDIEKQRRNQGWFAYLERCISSNRPWNVIVRELLVARPETKEDRGAVVFLLDRKENHQAMAEAVAPLVFGAKMDCAQCHDHPLAWEIEQRHYWGLVAAFNRSKPVDTKSGRGLAESATGGFISFANLKKESQPALLSFVNGRSVEERRPAADEKEEDQPELYVVPPVGEKEKPERPAVPKFSRRAELARVATEENPLLAKACVNRMWALYLGRGLVHPADQIDSKHPASHPDLLDWLAQDFAASGYDLRRLTRNLLLSEAYQRESRWTEGTPPRPETLARGIERPLSGTQFFESLLVATGNTVSADGKIGGRPTEDARWECASRFPDVFAEEYNASVGQALFLSNSPLMDDLLKPAEGNTTAKLAAIEDSAERVRTAYRTVLGRDPDGEELQGLTDYLERRDRTAGVRQLMWILVTSGEFLVNH